MFDTKFQLDAAVLHGQGSLFPVSKPPDEDIDQNIDFPDSERDKKVIIQVSRSSHSYPEAELPSNSLSPSSTHAPLPHSSCPSPGDALQSSK